MSKNRLKLVVWLVLLVFVALLALAIVKGLGQIIAFFGTGADPSSALNLIPVAPPDMDERLVWLPDGENIAEGRQPDPFTREQIAGAYLSGWAQVAISHEVQQPYGLKTYFSGQSLDQVSQTVTTLAEAGWNVHQSNLHHALAFQFLSADGAVAAITDRDARFVQHLQHPERGISQVNESSNTFDVLMLLEDGNWRIRSLVRRGDGDNAYMPAIATAKQRNASQGNFVVPAGRELLLDGRLFEIAGINYYPQASPWTEFWPNYDSTQTREDLAQIRKLGLNTVRIFVPFDDFGGDQVDMQMVADLIDLLDSAEEQEIKVLVTLFDHRTDHHPANWAADDRHLAQLIPPLVNHPAILGWDIKNEPDRDYDFNTQELSDAWLRHIAAEVRQLDPNHLLTIGWSNPEAATNLADIVDFVTYHYFDGAAEYTQRAENLWASVTDRPIVLGEFTQSTWNSIFPHGHTEAEQAAYYAELLDRHRAFDSPGYMVWTLYDFDKVPLGEFRTPWQRRQQANMGLIRRDGTYKPAADMVDPGSLLGAKYPPSWRRFTKPFWVFLFTCSIFFGLFIAWRIRRRRAKQSTIL